MRTGGMAMKSSAGYDLTGLLVGSEGTLGVYTELTLRLYPLPERIVAARAVFPDIEAAGRAAVAMIRTGMGIGRVELVDARTIGAVNAHKNTDYTVAPTLFLEFSGSEAGVENDVTVARETSAAEGCSLFEVEADAAAREKLWEARHDAALAIQNLYPSMGMMSTDVCVPISDLPGALRHARDTIEARGLEGAILGHVGDGNYHAVFPVNPRDGEDEERAERVLRKEHGDSLPFMREIKRVADPNGIMNPGKIFG
jgi:D-lactate dehydrogenase (cytochrome)